MARTYSLARLMFGVTLFCIVCGLAANFPLLAAECAVIAALFMPTAIVWFVMASLSQDSNPVLSACLFGTIVGFFLGDGILMGSGMSRGFQLDWPILSIPPAIGAAIFGSLALVAQTSPQRDEP